MRHRSMSVLSVLGWLVLKVLCATWRVSFVGPVPPYYKGPVIFCFWHGRQAGLLAHSRPRSVAVMSSLSRDGEIQAKILGMFGFKTVRGSSSRNGSEALLGLIGEIKRGSDAAFALDGPRGPYHSPKPGAIVAAKKTGAFLVPITFRARNEWVFEKSWDRYSLPKPFTKVEIVRGEPLSAQNCDEIRLKRAMETLG